jgi:DNA-binding MarR family transcriptional regulator
MVHPKVLNAANQRLIEQIQFTNHCILEKWNAFGKQKGLTYLQFKLLCILKESEIPLSTRQISEKLTDSMSDTSRLVDRLIQKGLVAKKTNSFDKRLIDVIILEKGKMVLDVFDSKSQQLDRIISSLPKEDLKVVSHFFEKLCNI